jgi:hypothetical protein
MQVRICDGQVAKYNGNVTILMDRKRTKLLVEHLILSTCLYKKSDKMFVIALNDFRQMKLLTQSTIPSFACHSAK